MNRGPQESARISRVRERMAELDLPALLVSQIDNVRWLSGFTGSHGFILLTPTDALFATDSRYTEQIESECRGFERVKLATSAPEEVTAILQRAERQRIGYEADHLTCHLYSTYREKLPAEVELVPTNRLVEDLRMIKDGAEIEAIERACAAVDRTFEFILPFLKPGSVEREIMLELEWFMRRDQGADVAFDTIVASGPRSALPHGRATERVMEEGDFVTLDFGARVDGYCSDITRTVVLGRPTAEQIAVYSTVLDAQQRAIDAMVPGAGGKEVDAIARGIISRAGHAEHFGHGLGHSLGRAVHDGTGLSVRSEITLKPGMVLTVEPGIYVPGWGGVRIEDDVLVSEYAPRILTHSPRDLIVL